ncbi:hypothetical protein ACFQVD_22765 [Streptosporangium amethystogenes subsp. fukuiense]|uniref:Uncharacterized protein n=1 Tax=Streptosporangium amethystogenes subsp. fukuiense TaxID=698418 RepID=A0ABW2T609_9ACTN
MPGRSRRAGFAGPCPLDLPPVVAGRFLAALSPVAAERHGSPRRPAGHRLTG